MAKTKTKPVGRTPTKRRDCEVWLVQRLADSPCLAREVLALGANSGWGWATVRRAKVNIGAQSFRKGEEWWWFDPRNFDPRKDALPQKRAEISQEEPILPAPLKSAEPAAEILLAVSKPAPQPSVTLLPPPPLVSQPPRTFSPGPSAASKPSTQQTAAPQPLFEKPVSSVVPPTLVPEIRKPIAPAKPRPFHIWDNAHTETRDSLIAAAGFVDLYNMLLDIRFRQEQLRARGLLKEEAALNELLGHVVDALERKKKAQSLE